MEKLYYRRTITLVWVLALSFLSPALAGLEFSIYNGSLNPIYHEHPIPEFSMKEIPSYTNAGRYIERRRDTQVVGGLGWDYGNESMCIYTPTRASKKIISPSGFSQSANSTEQLIGTITVKGMKINLGDFFKDPSKLVRGTWDPQTAVIKITKENGKTVPVFTQDFEKYHDYAWRTKDGQTPESFACDTSIHFVVDRGNKIAREENGITMSLP